jgi:hypothetical protein
MELKGESSAAETSVDLEHFKAPPHQHPQTTRLLQHIVIPLSHSQDAVWHIDIQSEGREFDIPRFQK